MAAVAPAPQRLALVVREPVTPAPDSFARSRFANAQAARRAVALALPTIEAALRDPAVSGLGVLHLVLLDAACSPASSMRFEDALLHEQSIGERARWDVDYAAYARAKAELAWRHGMDSRRVQMHEPQRLREGDALVWGSVWLDGIVVGASGAQPEWDEAFALTVAAHLRAIALLGANAARGTR